MLLKTLTSSLQIRSRSCQSAATLATGIAWKPRQSFFWIFKSRASKLAASLANAEEAYKKREYDQAISHFQESMKLDSENTQLDNNLRKMAVAYVSTNRIEESISCYLQLQAKYPNDVDISIAIALCYGKSNSPSKALVLFDEVLATVPNDAQRHAEVGLYCEQLGLIENAIAYYEKSIQLNPNEVNAYINLGYIHVRVRKDCEKALPYLLHAEKLDPENLDLIYNIGMCYFRLRDNKNAVEKLTKCITIDPTFHDAKRNLKYISGRP